LNDLVNGCLVRDQPVVRAPSVEGDEFVGRTPQQVDAGVRVTKNPTIRIAHTHPMRGAAHALPMITNNSTPPSFPGRYTTSRAVTVTEDLDEAVTAGEKWTDGEPRYGLTQATVTREQVAGLLAGLVLAIAIDVCEEYVVVLTLREE